MDRFNHTRLRVIHDMDQLGNGRQLGWLVPRPPPLEYDPKCWTCEDLNFRMWREDYTKYPIQVKIPMYALRGAASGGCVCCATLWNLVQSCQDNMYDIDSITLNSVKFRSPLVIFVDKKEQISGDSKGFDWKHKDTEYLEVFIEEGTNLLWSVIGPARQVSTDSSSRACMDLARKWIQQCVSSHKTCSNFASTPLPTRVIDVGSDDREPHLYEPHGEEGVYAALSHCWGTSVVMTTQLATLSERTRQVPMVTLPKTFRDAVILARALEIPYLWIDSLCIIQDSPDDWAKEAAKMADVYAKSRVCIVAEGAEDCTGGLFIGGPERNTKTSWWNGPGYFSSRTRVYVRKQMVRTNADSVAHGSGESQRSKLSTRGWVLQERLLAPRKLFFARSEMAWECAAASECECQVQSATQQGEFGVETFPRLFVREQIQRANNDGGTETWPHLKWTKVVEEYTQRDLTYSSDLLPALSGIAAAMQKATSYTYLAGIWKEELPWGLLWSSSEWERSSDKQFRPKRHQRYVAPSWSWASMESYVQYPGLPIELGGQSPVKYLVDVVETSCTPVGPNDFGPVSSGHITLSGPVVPVRILPMMQSRAKILDLSYWDIHISNYADDYNAFVVVSERSSRHSKSDTLKDPDFSTIPDLEETYAQSTGGEKIDTRPLFYNMANEDGQEKPPEDAYCPYSAPEPDVKDGDYGIDASQPHMLLLVAWWDTKSGKEPDKKQVNCILLAKAAQNPGEPEKWRRVGRVWGSGPYWLEDWQKVSHVQEITII